MNLKAVENGIYSIGKLKHVFDTQLQRSQLLQALWKPASKSEVNNMKTLPLAIRPKVDLHRDIAKESGKEGWSLKAAQSFGYAKELVKFYKHGVKLVWNNHKTLRALRKSDFKVTNQINNEGKTVDIQVPSFATLTQEMAQGLYQKRVENRTNIENTAGDAVDHNKGSALKAYTPEMFNLLRSDFLLFKRTPSDFIKIPSFSVIFLIFMEMTPLLCYAFPEITPLTCILPSLLPRLWSAKNSDKVAKSVPENTDLEELAAKTAYNLTLEQVASLADALRLKTKYIPTQLFPELVLRNRLQAHYNFLTVDNYYLSGLNGNGNVWDLTKQELLYACLERNLIRDVKKYADLEESHAPNKDELVKHELNILRLQLTQFIMNFEKYNIGYLLLLQKVEQPSEEAITWREE